METSILHVDMNNFFASVSCISHPELAGKPVAVCGDIEKRHGIILAKNTIAKQRGVKTGATIGEARFFFPELCFLPPDSEKYMQYSRRAREIYLSYTDRVESFGIDECWLDVSGSQRLFGDGVTIADDIRRRIREELGITASIGVSYNKIFAKMGSDYKKPDATTLITEENFRELLWPLPVDALLFAGRSTKKQLHLYGIDTIGALACADFEQIVSLLGKCGAGLWQFANGLDRTPVRADDHAPPIKSIGNGTTAPRDLISDDDIFITMRVLSDSVGMRLRRAGLRCRTVQIELRDKHLAMFCRQCKVPFPTDVGSEILDAAFALYKSTYRTDLTAVPVRSLSVRATDLESAADDAQLSLAFDMEQHLRAQTIEQTVDRLRGRFGNRCVRSALLYTDRGLSDFTPRAEQIF